MVVVADDLTGAADTGVQFARVGLPAHVWLGRHAAPRHGAVVYDANSRSLAPAAAARRVGRLARAIAHAPTTLVYKKIDSTVRGNVGAEVEALLRALGRRLAVVAPAFPANGRTTRGGVQLVAGVPVHLTAAARDPAHPMPHASIAEALGSQSTLPIAEVGLDEVRGRLGAALREALARGPAFAVVDAETDEDLARIAEAVLALGSAALPVGSAGLAGQLARRLGRPAPSPRPSPPGRGGARRALVVCGSLNPATVAQIGELEAVLGTRATDPLTGEVAVPAEGPIVLSTAARRVDAAAPAVARRIAGRVARLVERAGADALVLTGGDVARAVLDRLGAEGVELVDEVLPGMPAGRIVGGAAAGWPVVTKAGGFGPPDALVRALRYLQTSDREETA